MNLLEAYEELFQYICRLNRAAKAETHPDYARVRSEVRTILDEIVRNAAKDVYLLNQVKRLELPMIFFVDNLICTSRLKFAAQWAGSRLAKEKNELAGDERFFDFLDQDLTDTSEEAAERLSIYYVCLGLGFMGMYQTQPEQIRIYMDKIFPRIRQWMDVDPRAKITEEAYKSTDTRMLTEPPSRKIVFVALLFVFLALVVLSVIYGLYVAAARDLTGSISQIIKAGGSVLGQ
jgi:type IV/VI secretion system ImpK/VasF family protein